MEHLAPDPEELDKELPSASAGRPVNDDIDCNSQTGSEELVHKVLDRVREERDHLQQEVEAITKFLADYGLTWVGEGTEGEAEGQDDAASNCSAADATGGSSKGNSPCVKSLSGSEVCVSPVRSREPTSPGKSASPASPPGILQVDVRSMHEKVESLNAMVEKAGARIMRDRIGGAVHARIVADDALPLPLTFFQDGVKLGSLSFHEYSSRETQLLLRDVLDGYFPYVLKDLYPDGVAMKVVDRMAYTFETWFGERALEDQELTDGGARLLPSGGHVLGRGASRVLSPQRGGGGAAGQARGALVTAGLSTARLAPAEEISLLPAAAAATSEEADEEDGATASSAVARVQVRLEGGQRLVFTMAAAQTIGELSEALSRWLLAKEGLAPPALQLRSAFPPRTYDDLLQTLQVAGLTPSATLFAAAEGKAVEACKPVAVVGQAPAA